MLSSEIVPAVDRKDRKVQIPQFFIGARYEASMPKPTDGDVAIGSTTPILDKLTDICRNESIGSLSPSWIAVMVKYPYSAASHVMMVPNADMFKSDEKVWCNISMVPDEDLNRAFQLMACGADGMRARFPELTQAIWGLNAKQNKSLPFLHMQLVGIDASWQAISPAYLALANPERYRLFMENSGCEVHDNTLASQLMQQFSDLFAHEYMVANSGSCFMPFRVSSMEQLAADGAFLPMMRWLDHNLRTMLDAWPIDQLQQCFSISVSQYRDGVPTLVFQTAVRGREGPPSGVMEANHFAFEETRRMMTPEQNTAYQVNCRLIADGMRQRCQSAEL